MGNVEFSGNYLPTGLDRMKIDLLFDLAAGHHAGKGFSYDQQRDYYIREIYGDDADVRKMIQYGKNYKLFSEYMFPNQPWKIRSKKILCTFFANCVLLDWMYRTGVYSLATDETEMRRSCLDVTGDLSGEAGGMVRREIVYLHSQYTAHLTEADYDAYLQLMNRFSDPFRDTLETVKKYMAEKYTVEHHAAESRMPESRPSDLLTDYFLPVCEKLAVPLEKRLLFRLELDALAEIQIGNNDFVDYIAAFKQAWREKFPQYSYDDSVEKYLRSKKGICISAFGNRLKTIRNERALFELLAAVNIKLALSNGAADPNELHEKVTAQTKNLSDNIRSHLFNECEQKMTRYYDLGQRENYSAALAQEMIPYKTGLLYVNDILMEEIERRDKSNRPSQQSRMRDDQSDSEMEKYARKYDVLISQKDAEIYDLKRELEYYEGVRSQEFRSELSQYTKAMMDIFQRLCDRKYGAPLNELYLMGSGLSEFSSEKMKAAVQNFLFVLDGIGISPYDADKIGKKVPFDSEEANVVYAVNEKDIAEGLNRGLLNYPGWRYKGENLVLPWVTMETEADQNG